MPTRRYPVVPVLAVLLAVAAVVILVVFGYQSIHGFGEAFASWKHGSQPMYPGMGGGEAVTGFGKRMESLLSPLFALGQGLFLAGLSWGFGALITALRDIEFNTRKPEAEIASVGVKTPAAE